MLSFPSLRQSTLPSEYSTCTVSMVGISSSALLSTTVDASTGMLAEGLPSKNNNTLPPEELLALHLSNWISCNVSQVVNGSSPLGQTRREQSKPRHRLEADWLGRWKFIWRYRCILTLIPQITNAAVYFIGVPLVIWILLRFMVTCCFC